MELTLNDSYMDITLSEQTDLNQLYIKARELFKQNNNYLLANRLRYICNENHEEMIKTINRALVDTLYNYGNSANDSLIGVEHMLKNLNVIQNNPGINLFKGKLKGIPAVVVATGPSLNKNKHLLKGLDRVLIISCDASLKILLDMGVEPHLCTMVERDLPMADLFRGLKPGRCKLVACPVVHPEVYKVYEGKTIIAYRNFDHFKWLGIERGIMDIGITSGNMAFKIADYMGCDPIILIGQDLAYGDGATHAEGVVFGENQWNYDKIPAKGNVEDIVYTTEPFLPCIRGYEMDIAEHKGTCINATEGGAYINGTKVMKFEEAIQNIHAKNDYFKLIDDIVKGFTPSDSSHVKKLIIDTIKDLNLIKENCNKGLMSNNMEEIIKLKSSCGIPFNTWQLFLAHITQSYIIQHALSLKTDIPHEHEWFSVIRDISQICINMLEEI